MSLWLIDSSVFQPLPSLLLPSREFGRPVKRRQPPQFQLSLY
jgi:hypothetical protein